MKILGITAEYNPFHNGDKYHLKKSVEAVGVDYTVAVMSGNFTQRGEVAILDKWTRSRLAVENGVDLVVELPFIFACNRAEIFARGAVDILTRLGATQISFGSESGELEKLQALTDALSEHEGQIAEKRSMFMQQGNSFAKSNQLAVEEILGKEAAELLLEPNNILALEYLKRMLYWTNQGKVVQPVTVKRYGSGYFDGNEEEGFAGASHIRSLSTAEEMGKYVPENVKVALADRMNRNGETSQIDGRDIEEEHFRLIRALIVRSSSEELSRLYCMGEGLENKFKKEIIRATNLKELLSAMVSRRYTEATIRRLLVYILVGLKGRSAEEALYARVLAANEKGRALLKTIKKQECSSIPVITNINKETALSEEIHSALHYDILASDMYNLLHGRDLYAFSDKVMMPYME